jgi:outer membrane immunogenic protein
MKLKVLAGVAVIAAICGTSALAADMPVKAVPYVAPVYNWTGFYIGGNFGGAWGNTAWLDDGTAGVAGTVDASYDTSGILGGGQIGFNYQIDRWVWGVEADFDAASITGGGGACFTAGGPGNTCSSKADWLTTVTGRVGIAFDRALIYFDGGWAEVHEKYSNPFNFGVGATGVDAASETRNGYTIGGGIEYALAGPWSMKAEYNYIGLGTKDLLFCEAAGCFYSENLRSNLNEIKAGINYRFGWPMH